ncbi:unnamed protein product, partial [Iphiclides podalirius]
MAVDGGHIHQPVENSSYAAALKLPKGGSAVPFPTRTGPILAFYPTEEHAQALKSTDDTKAALKKAIKPGTLGNRDTSCRHCAVASVHLADGRETVLISAYFQYAEPIGQHIMEVERALDHLAGRSVVIGLDAYAHSPMWYSHPRHYIGRGHEAENRRAQMEDFINGRGLIVGNREGHPYTFCGPNGVSNIDLTLTSRGAAVLDWQVRTGASSSDHRLLKFRITEQHNYEGEQHRPTVDPPRFRERGKCKRLGGQREVLVGNAFRAARRRYRAMMEEEQHSHFLRVADSGNTDLWGQAYRIASGRVHPPANVVNGVEYAGARAESVEEAAGGLLRALCPDDDVSKDEIFHRRLRASGVLKLRLELAGASRHGNRRGLGPTPPRSHVEVTKTRAGTSGGEKRTLQSPKEVGTNPQKPRMELRTCRPTTPAPTPPIGATSSGGVPIPDTQGTHGQELDTGLEKSSKMARNNMQAIMGIVTGPQSSILA